jgi:hypothetical protein
MQSRPLRNGTAPSEEQLGRHEILRAPRGLRTRPQDDNVFLLQGAAPPAPLLCLCKHSFQNKKYFSLREKLPNFAFCILHSAFCELHLINLIEFMIKIQEKKHGKKNRLEKDSHHRLGTYRNRSGGGV